MARRARRLTDHDQAEWASFARHIKPLRGRGRSTPVVEAEPTAAPPPAAVAPPRPRPVPPVLRAVPAPVNIGAEPGGVDRATWQRFRGGKVNAARKLDLHGMTTQHAYHALMSFLRTAHADRLRCVEVVTGRGSGEGTGTIRREFPMWLNLPDIRPLILAASHPHAANPGSVRLLLRRVR